MQSGAQEFATSSQGYHSGCGILHSRSAPQLCLGPATPEGRAENRRSWAQGGGWGQGGGGCWRVGAQKECVSVQEADGTVSPPTPSCRTDTATSGERRRTGLKSLRGQRRAWAGRRGRPCLERGEASRAASTLNPSVWGLRQWSRWATRGGNQGAPPWLCRGPRWDLLEARGSRASPWLGTHCRRWSGPREAGRRSHSAHSLSRSRSPSPRGAGPGPGWAAWELGREQSGARGQGVGGGRRERRQTA